jgi:hypothetical protein
MSCICRGLLAVVATIAFAGIPGADLFAQSIIVGYDSTNPNGAGGDPAPDLAAAEAMAQVNPLLLSRGPGLVPNQGIAFNSRDWSTATTLNTSIGDYVQWGWSASTVGWNLENFTIQYDRSTSGPTQLAILLSANGGAYQSVFSDSSVNIGDETHTVSLTAFDNITSASFRLFGFDASSTGGTLDIERFNADPAPPRAIVVRGFAVPIPEPAAMGALLLVVGSLVAMARPSRRF